MTREELTARLAECEGYTEGQWGLGGKDNPIGYFPIFARIGLTKLARVALTDAHEVGFGISEKEHKANARLIALAPALASALREAWAEIDKLKSEQSSLVKVLDAALNEGDGSYRP